jgi:hypothetical protein
MMNLKFREERGYGMNGGRERTITVIHPIITKENAFVHMKYILANLPPIKNIGKRKGNPLEITGVPARTSRRCKCSWAIR